MSDNSSIPQKPPFEETPEFIASSVKYLQDSLRLVRKWETASTELETLYHERKAELIKKLTEHRNELRQLYERGDL